MPTKEELIEKLASRRRKRVTYHGIGRYLAVFAGSMQMVDAGEIPGVLDSLKKGEWSLAATRLKRLFMDPTMKQRIEGAALMGIGVGTGKVLDKAKVNPHIELIAGHGIKLW